MDVASVEESRFRLPLQFAQTLYDAGESGMGYLLFTVVFDDGSQAAYCLGNGSIDFLDYPTNKGPRNVVNVAPHAGRSDPNLRHGADYRWCLYSEAL
ncbi:MAG TPA: hypothetical protein VL992_16125 [Tepidisphaeraceae bacterium]|nr:hypothetical protein [Tepidisphaeraceae bacterium]